MENDNVNNPKHYTSHPSGIECIQITEHCSFTIGNAIKYLWRADLKNGVEDLKKAAWYINREIQRRELQSVNQDWPTDDRIDAIGQNGGDGEHYDKVTNTGVYEA